MTRRLGAALPDAPVVVLTGGWAGLLADHLERADHHRPHLVLDGVRLLAEASAA
jgi:pantothenate kinase type III